MNKNFNHEKNNINHKPHERHELVVRNLYLKPKKTQIAVYDFLGLGKRKRRTGSSGLCGSW